MPISSSSQDIVIQAGDILDMFSSLFQTHTYIVGGLLVVVSALLVYLIPRSLRGEMKEHAENVGTEVLSEVGKSNAAFEQKIMKMVGDIRKEVKENDEDLESRLRTELTSHEITMESIRAETYRSMAQSHDENSRYSTAFVWYLRAAMACKKSQDDNMTRTHLQSALVSLRNVTSGTSLTNGSIMEEWNTFAGSFESPTHQTEIDLLKEEFRKALDKEPAKSESV